MTRGDFINLSDTRTILSTVPEIVKDALLSNSGLVYAGGSIRDYYLKKEPKDYDLFCLNVLDWDHLIRYARKLKRNVDGYKEFDLSVKVIDKNGKECDFVHPTLKNAGDLIGLLMKFDFTVNMFAIWYDNSKEEFIGVQHKHARICIRERKLFFNEDVYSGLNVHEVAILMRLARLSYKGFSISRMQCAKIVKYCAGLHGVDLDVETILRDVNGY